MLQNKVISARKFNESMHFYPKNNIFDYNEIYYISTFSIYKCNPFLFFKDKSFDDLTKLSEAEIKSNLEFGMISIFDGDVNLIMSRYKIDR